MALKKMFCILLWDFRSTENVRICKKCIKTVCSLWILVYVKSLVCFEKMVMKMQDEVPKCRYSVPERLFNGDEQ